MYIENTECKLLSNGLKLPLMGLGTFGIPKRDFTNAMFAAAQCGLRLMNTADNYNNELYFGRGLRKLLNLEKANDLNVPLLNYFDDERFISSDLYINSFFFNIKERLLFTEAVVDLN